MTSETTRVTIHIMDSEYRVSCPEGEEDKLVEAARYLNEKMHEIRDSGKVIGVDRIAVIAALNLANELIKLRNKDRRVEEELGGRVRAMRERIDAALASGQQIEL